MGVSNTQTVENLTMEYSYNNWKLRESMTIYYSGVNMDSHLLLLELNISS
jgi:hypothetical protein